jgi:hypothetical protein
MTLPTFVVIGAMKAGTVSLRHYLDEHPDVFLDGADQAAAIGECSPSYTMAPAFRGVAERMAQVIPDARLVYVVRDPIARMQSMYMHQVSASHVRH